MINLLNVVRYFNNLDHQVKSLEKLQKTLEEVVPELLANDADWVKLWRTSPVITQTPTNQKQSSSSLLPDWKGGDRAATVRAIRNECDRQGLKLTTQKAYMLATVELETANTFEPVRESFWFSEEWRRANHWYYPYYGRGYVQLTHDFNYRRYGEILGLNLLDNPDLVMRPDLSLFILVHGSKFGVFTSHRIEDHINSSKTDYWNARRVINGTDRASKIEGFARDWEQWLKANP